MDAAARKGPGSGSRRTVRLAALLVALALEPAEARASKCLPPSLPRALASADAVFVGRALRTVDDGDTVFAVERVYKGEAPAEVIARFHGVKYARLTPPGRYLVFGVLEPAADGAFALVVPVCSGSAPAEARAPELA